MCTGQGLFLDPAIPKHPSYNKILAQLKNGATLVDIGAFLGQDLRRFVVDGAPSTSLYVIDIVNHWDLGYDLFRDREKFHAHYIETDILYPSPELRKCKGSSQSNIKTQEHEDMQASSPVSPLFSKLDG